MLELFREEMERALSIIANERGLIQGWEDDPATDGFRVWLSDGTVIIVTFAADEEAV